MDPSEKFIENLLDHDDSTVYEKQRTTNNFSPSVPQNI